MAVNIHKLIAAISPDLYCDKSKIKEVKKAVKEKGYLEAAKKAKPRASEFMDFGSEEAQNSLEKHGLENPIEKHSLSYETEGQNLEPLYFWILDNLEKEVKYGHVEKLIDNFVSSPGSSHFSEMGARATRMHDEAMKILGAVNQVVKSVLNLIYDLKEFRLRLKIYEQYNSNKRDEKNNALLSLKQIWLDNVDIKKGNTSIKALAFGNQSEFITLIDAFMAAESVKLAEKLDLNERVKRILHHRLQEFFNWIKESEKELRKRFEIEKSYLKSQINTIKLYARWAKPYLKAARALEQMSPDSPSLVTAFNTTMFELLLMGDETYFTLEDMKAGKLPQLFKNYKGRKYHKLVFAEIRFRTIPHRFSQQGGYTFFGRIEVDFTSYGLSEDELKVFKESLGEDDFDDMIQGVEGLPTDSLEELKDDIEEFLSDKDEEGKEEDSNPFSALFSIFKSEKSGKKEKKELPIPTKSDNELEKVMRSQAIISARKKCRNVYHKYKRAHSLPAF